MMTRSLSQPVLQGVGVSLRNQHFSVFLEAKQPVDWLEVVADHYLYSRGVLLDRLRRICRDYPVNLHCVSLSLAGSDPIDSDYLQQIQILTEALQPHYISDHLCWSSHQGEYSHDLLPFPYTKKNIAHVAGRIQYVQERVKKPLLLENLSHYVRLDSHEMDEAMYLNALCEQTGCGILLDINNIYVTSQNLTRDAKAYINSINPIYVKQCHLAGHRKTRQRLIDAHDSGIASAVWSLYQYALQRLGAIPTCLEWDTAIPSWPVMLREVARISEHLKSAPQPANQVTNKRISNEISNMIVAVPESLMQFQYKIWRSLSAKQELPDENPLSVHQHSMRMQRLLALENLYPCARQCLHPERFARLAMAYIMATPSVCADISQGMHSFCDYLETALHDDEYYIYDLARYEWLWYRVFHDVNHDEVDKQRLTLMLQDYGEQILLQQSDGCRFIQCRFPALQIWESCQEEYQGPDTATLLQAVAPDSFCYVLHQRHSFVMTVALSVAAYDSLRLLEAPLKLARWCEDAAKIQDFDPAFIAYFYQTGLIELSSPEETVL